MSPKPRIIIFDNAAGLVWKEIDKKIFKDVDYIFGTFTTGSTSTIRLVENSDLSEGFSMRNVSVYNITFELMSTENHSEQGLVYGGVYKFCNFLIKANKELEKKQSGGILYAAAGRAFLNECYIYIKGYDGGPGPGHHGRNDKRYTAPSGGAVDAAYQSTLKNCKVTLIGGKGGIGGKGDDGSAAFPIDYDAGRGEDGGTGGRANIGNGVTIVGELKILKAIGGDGGLGGSAGARLIGGWSGSKRHNGSGGKGGDVRIPAGSIEYEIQAGNPGNIYQGGNTLDADPTSWGPGEVIRI